MLNNLWGVLVGGLKGLGFDACPYDDDIFSILSSADACAFELLMPYSQKLCDTRFDINNGVFECWIWLCLGLMDNGFIEINDDFGDPDFDLQNVIWWFFIIDYVVVDWK